MKKLLFTHKLPLLTITVVPTIVFFCLIARNFVFGGAEEGIPFYDIQNTIRLYSSVWVDQVPGFPLIFETGKVSFLSIFLIISKLVSPTVVSALFISSLMLIGGLGMYSLATILLWGDSNYRFSATVASIFYILNPFTLSQVWGRHLSMQMYPFALIPGFLFLIISGHQKRRTDYLIYGVLLSVFLAGAFNHPSYVISLIGVTVLYFAVSLTDSTTNRIYTTGYVIKFLFLFVLANSFWILPYYSQFTQPNDFIGNSDNLSIFTSLSAYSPLSAVLLLKQKYYFDVAQTFGPIYNSLPFRVLALSIPTIAALGFIKLKQQRSRHTYFILTVLVLTVIVCTGANLPFGPLLIFIIKKLPLLEIYRNSFEKFGLFLLLPYSILFGLGFSFLKTHIQQKRRALVIILISIGLFGVYMFPIWNTSVFQEHDASSQPPEEYDQIARSLAPKNFGRVLLTPILPGDATTQEWSGKQYRGIDISPFVFDFGTLTRELPGLTGNNLVSGIRKRMQKQDVSEVLKALRITTIVNRGDIVTSQPFKNQTELLTSQTYSPSKALDAACEKPLNVALTEKAFYACQSLYNDLSPYKYLRFKLSTNTPIALEIRLLDKNGYRSRWDGKADVDYQITANTEEVILPIGTETELPSQFSYNAVTAVEISFFPIPSTIKPDVRLIGIYFDKGDPIQLSTYKKNGTFGMLDVYETTDKVLPMVRVPQSIKHTSDINTFIDEYRLSSSESYMVLSEKHTNLPQGNSSNLLVSSRKISSTKYEVNVESEDPAYIWLGTNFDAGWKVTPIKTDSSLSLLQSVVFPEENHFLADGYANLWTVKGSTTYTLYYLPSVYVDLGQKITLLTLFATGIAFVFRGLKLRGK